MGDGIEEVTLVKEWVFDDLSSSTFSSEEKGRFLDNVDKLEEDLVVWGRPISKCLDILRNTGSETIYRQRIGDLRAYYVRREGVMYCIGVGKRKKTYDRDVAQVIGRANDL